MTERSDSHALAPVPRLDTKVVSEWQAGSGLAPALAGVPAVQAAAVAAGGFVAGAVVVGVLGRRRRRRSLVLRPRRDGTRRRSARELVEIVGSRSLLVDIHLLGSAPARGR